jgi:hypothetical protein
MTADDPGGLDLELMARIISSWDLMEATDPDMTFEQMVELLTLTCYCKAGDIADALIWAGRMP